MVKKLRANKVLCGWQAGSKKDSKGVYLGSMRDLKFLRVYRIEQVALVPKKGSVYPQQGSIRNQTLLH